MADWDSLIVRVIGAASGVPTPHDGRYVVAWNPHVPFGTVAVNSTDDITKAARFPGITALQIYRTISRAQPTRYDGQPNRPLMALTCEFIRLGGKPTNAMSQGG